MFKKILIICVGNICRSPAAEAWLKKYCHDNNLDIEINSAGISAMVDEPASQYSQEVSRDNNLDVSQHIAQQMTPELLQEHDLILVMEEDMVKFINANFPFTRGKVFRIGHWNQQDIPDPYKKPKYAFETMYKNIENGLLLWTEHLR